MTIFNKMYEAIELHNNSRLKSLIIKEKTFDINKHYKKNKKTLLHASILCNNYEAYKMLIDHFYSIKMVNIDVFNIALQKYRIV